MFEKMARAGELDGADLEHLTPAFACRPMRTVACVSREPSGPSGFCGRVTKALANLASDPAKTEFYVCGSAAVVTDCQTILERAGARRILTELY